jgi:hypothetical protein
LLLPSSSRPLFPVEKHFQERASTQRSLHCAPPDFLLRAASNDHVCGFLKKTT